MNLRHFPIRGRGVSQAIKLLFDQKTGAFAYHDHHHAHHHLCELLLLCHCSFDFSCWSISWWHCLIIDCISPAADNMVHPPNHHLTHLTLVQSALTTNQSQHYPKSSTLTTNQSQIYYISSVDNMVHPPTTTSST